MDVPELGYFTSDKPFPRGELLVLTDTMIDGYYKHQDVRLPSASRRPLWQRLHQHLTGRVQSHTVAESGDSRPQFHVKGFSRAIAGRASSRAEAGPCAGAEVG